MIGLILAVIAMIMAGFTTSTLWFWFIVPLGIVAISVPQAIGIDLLFGLLTLRVHKAEDTPTPIEHSLVVIIASIILLFFFLVASFFM